MRLLNVYSMKLEEFIDSERPEYAILSHTWGKEEVSYQDMERGTAESNAAWTSKILPCCQTASRDGYGHLWIDTCCIDKTSSAELSEAINSMYRWYQCSAACYAYLEDVSSINRTEHEIDIALSFSRWFSRGWTLQELIAPAKVIFFSKEWFQIGSKSSRSAQISRITNIDEKILIRPQLLRDSSIARRMSWAAKRETTRIEDIAYCLLGIFGVNMPLLYGEGERAFLRLQEEIIKDSVDESLFAWHSNQEFYHVHGPFARHPADYKHSAKVVPFVHLAKEPHVLTSKGLRIHVPIIRDKNSARSIAVLSCHYDGNLSGPLGIIIIPASAKHDNAYHRDTSRDLQVVEWDLAQTAVPETIYISKYDYYGFDRSHVNYQTSQFWLFVRKIPQPTAGYRLVTLFPQGQWDMKNRTARLDYTRESVRGAVIFSHSGYPGFSAIFTISQGGSSCDIYLTFKSDPDEIEDLLLKSKTDLTYDRTETATSKPLRTVNDDKILGRITRCQIMNKSTFAVDIGLASEHVSSTPPLLGKIFPGKRLERTDTL